MRIVLCPDAARARPRGLAARAADARHDRRRDPDAAGGVGRRAARCCSARATRSSSSTRASRRPRASPCVSAMHAAGAKQATEHLLALGHRRIGAIAGAPRLVRDRGAADRLPRGARRRRASCSTRSSIVYSDWRIAARRREAARAAARRCPSRRPRSSASTTTSRSARCTPRASAGSRVPDDLSIVGFDDTEQAAIVTPQLTSVRQPLAEMGRMGVSLLIAADRGTARRRAAHRARRRRSSCASRRRRRGDAVRVAVRRGARRRRRWRRVALRVALGGARRRVRRATGSSPTSGARARTSTARSSTRGGSPRARPGRGGRRTRRRDTSTLYSGDRPQAAADRARRRRADRRRLLRRQAASASRRAASSDPARFIYACEDGMLRAWTPTVPDRLVDAARGRRRRGGEAARLPRRRDRAGARLYATDFHNARVDVLRRALAARPSRRRVRRSGDPGVVRAVRHPGDRRPRLRHVRLARAGERQRRADRRLRRRVRPRRSARRARRAPRRAERAVGARARAAALRPLRRRPARRQLRRRPDQRVSRATATLAHDGTLQDAHGKPLVINGLWGIAFGNGGMAGPRDTLFFTAGPHDVARRDRAAACTACSARSPPPKFS